MLGSAGSALFTASLNQVNRIDPEARGVHHLTIHIISNTFDHFHLKIPS